MNEPIHRTTETLRKPGEPNHCRFCGSPYMEVHRMADEIERLNRVRLDLASALRAAIKWLPDDIQKDVMSGDTSDFVKYTDDYKNDHASMVVGWRLL